MDYVYAACVYFMKEKTYLLAGFGAEMSFLV